ncbi:MAG: DUF2791 family P-loop domain-containing protein, partial [Clostridia bacterium]|nr:DUF2791 family P-loop domain-containing protein [Clostridia bacterium]
EEKKNFISIMTSRTGAAEMITPREIIREYIALLDLLRTDPSKNFDEIVSKCISPGDTNVRQEGKRTVTLDDIEL